MKMAIKSYYNRMKKYPNYYENEDFSEISIEIKKKFKKGTIPIERNDKTDVSLFKKAFGYDLPDEIEGYINLFWHSYISGYLGNRECIVLFPVLKKEGDSSNDILFYKNSLMPMAEEWSEMGDIQKYIPVGWLGYSGAYVLYEVKTNKIYLEDITADTDGEIENIPIASCLKELIENMVIRG